MSASTPRISRRRTVLGISLGNALEWYDWTVYAAFASFFAHQFFHSESQLASLFAALAVFAVGFVARPLGGMVFGFIGDRRGRRAAMSSAVILAAGGCLLIGLTPTYDTIGILAPALLVIARLGQGLAHGGEMPSSQAYLAEVAPPSRRGLWGSLIYVSGTAGIASASLIGAAITTVLSTEQMSAWGWRIPFIIGGVLGLIALWMRRSMPETEVFTESAGAERDGSPGILRTLAGHWRQALLVMGTAVGLTIAYYAWVIGGPAYAISSRGIEPSAAFWAGVVGSLVFMAALPLWGHLSDRVGRRPVFIGGALVTAATLIPLNASIGSSGLRLTLALALGLVSLAACLAIMSTIQAELFPVQIRTIGVGVPYSVCVAAFGGTAPYLQVWLSEVASPLAFQVYVVCALLLTALTGFLLPETRAKDLAGSAREPMAR